MSKVHRNFIHSHYYVYTIHFWKQKIDASIIMIEYSCNFSILTFMRSCWCGQLGIAVSDVIYGKTFLQPQGY